MTRLCGRCGQAVYEDEPGYWFHAGPIGQACVIESRPPVVTELSARKTGQ